MRYWSGRETAGNIVYAECHHDTKTIWTRPIVSRETLYYYLHEVGHARQQIAGCFWAAEEYETEYEAEIYAIAAMRAAGIPVPRRLLDEARDYVFAHAECSKMALEDGGRAEKFAGYMTWPEFCRWRAKRLKRRRKQ